MEKKYERARSAFESADSKLKSMNEKTKPNLAKVVEAEQERDACKTALEATQKEATKYLVESSSKLELDTMARVVLYFETYYEFLEETMAKFEKFMPEIEEYRNYIEQNLQQLEKESGKTYERILPPKKVRKSFDRKSVSLTSEDAEEDEGKNFGFHLPFLSLFFFSSAEDFPFAATPKTKDKKKKTLEDAVKGERKYLQILKSILNVKSTCFFVLFCFVLFLLSCSLCLTQELSLYVLCNQKKNQNFQTPLVKVKKDPKLKITEEDLQAVFYNIEPLYNMHESMCKELELALEKYTPNSENATIILSQLSLFFFFSTRYPTVPIVEIFSKRLQQMAIYTDYVKHFGTSIETLNKMKKTRAVASLIKVFKFFLFFFLSFSSLHSFPLFSSICESRAARKVLRRWTWEHCCPFR
jgi:hypothetical protein